MVCISYIRWLVKRLYESRDARSEVNKKLASHAYIISYKPSKPEAPKNVNKISKKLHGPRLFKRKNIYDIELRDPKRVYSTLLEFNDPTSKEYYRRLVETYGASPEQAQKKTNVGQSVFIGKRGDAKNADAGEFGDEAANKAHKGLDEDDSPRKGSEEMARLEGEIEKISDQETQIKGENIGKLFVENLQHIADTVAEYETRKPMW